MAATIAQQRENLRTPENLKKELLNYYSRGIEAGTIDIDCWTEGGQSFCRVDMHLETGDVITLLRREVEGTDTGKAIRSVWEKIFLPFC
jgi:hypothetical protein